MRDDSAGSPAPHEPSLTRALFLRADGFVRECAAPPYSEGTCRAGLVRSALATISVNLVLVCETLRMCGANSVEKNFGRQGHEASSNSRSSRRN